MSFEGTGANRFESGGPTSAPPATVVTAVRLMYAQIALAIVSLALSLTMKDELRDAIVRNNRSLSASRVDRAVNAGLAIGVVVALLFIVLYLLLTFQVRKGKSWARIVTLVLAGLGVLGVLGNLFQPEPTITRVVSLIQGVILISLIVALSRSSAYFSRPAGYR